MTGKTDKTIQYLLQGRINYSENCNDSAHIDKEISHALYQVIVLHRAELRFWVYEVDNFVQLHIMSSVHTT